MSACDFELTLQGEGTHEEEGPLALHAAPARTRLELHFVDELSAYAAAGGDASGNRDQLRELLALGGIRRIYWLALGAGETKTATEIAEWWRDCAPLHNLGETIR